MEAPSRVAMAAGNKNLTNIKESYLFDELAEEGRL